MIVDVPPDQPDPSATGADRFRVTVGRFRDRWYTDPLPSCPIAEASDWRGPAVTTVKRASGSDWSNVTIGRLASAYVAHRDRWAKCKTAVDVAAHMRSVNSAGLAEAAARGTAVHVYVEKLLRGETAITPAAAAEPYRPAIDAWFQRFQPSPVHVEFACFNRGLHDVGFGGTADAVIKIDGGSYLVDWKSRDRYAVYANEAAQLGGYRLADYIVADNGRELFPQVDAGLIVAITPAGVRSYEIDLDAASDQFIALHAWWTARRGERRPIGRPWATIEPVDEENESGVDAATSSPVSTTLVSADMQRQQRVEQAWNPQPTPPASYPKLTSKPAEGDPVDVDRITVLRDSHALMSEPQRRWVSDRVSESQRQSTSIHMGQAGTSRRYHACKALVAYAHTYITYDNDGDANGDGDGGEVGSVFRACLAVLVGDVAHNPTWTIGAIVGSLHAAQTVELSSIVDDLVALRTQIVYLSDGRPPVLQTANQQQLL